MALTLIADHVARAVSRLASQYQQSASVVGLVKLATAETQVLENVLFDEFVETVDSATGNGLDVMGKVVGQPREGRDDTTYRTWIKARVQVNRCGGTAPEIIAIFMALCPGLTLRLEELYPAALVMHVTGTAIPNPDSLASILRLIKAAGVKATLETTTAIPGTTFTLDVGPGLDVGLLADARE
jgi:hypothetical protein